VRDFSKLGYTKSLYILPFDHRATFAKNLFGKESILDLSGDEREAIRELKMLIYRGFKDAVEKLIPVDAAAILCDEEFGSEILIDALHNGFITLLPVEKSGKKEFEFQYEDFADHIERFHPKFVKALVRYNPQDPQDSKKRQKNNLKKLSDYCEKNNHKFLLEVLVIPTQAQLKEIGTKQMFDSKLRQELIIEAIKDFQNSGIEPDIWKLEGFDKEESYKEIIEEIKAGGRDNVNLIILGRGEKKEEVEEWLEAGVKEMLTIGSRTEGVIGFAVGRTVFWNAVEKFHRGQIGKAEAIQTISENFQHFYKVFTTYSS